MPPRSTPSDPASGSSSLLTRLALSGAAVINLSRTTRYGIAVGAAVVGILVRLVLEPVWGIRFPYITLFPAIMLSAWLGGLWPGIVTTLIGGAASSYFWIEPARSWDVIEKGTELLGVSVFVVVGGMISVLNEAWRRAASAIAHSEGYLKTTLRSIGDAVITTDGGGLVSGMNPVAETLTGWREADAVGRSLMTVFAIMNEQSRQPAENPVPRVLREGKVASLANHTILVARDGREIPIDDSAAPIMGADGAVIGAVLVFRDISERRRAERERASMLEREQESRERTERAAGEIARLQAVTDTALSDLDRQEMVGELLVRVRAALGADTATLLLLDPDGQHLTPVMSEGLTEELGLDIRIPIGHGVAGRIALADGPMVFDDLAGVDVVSPILMARVSALLGAPLKVEGRLVGVLQAGSRTPRRFTEADQRLLSLVANRVAIALDRTRLHGTERDAREQAEIAERRLRIALQAGHMGHWEWTLDSGRVKWSPELEAIHGLDAGRFPGTIEAFRQEIHPEDRERVERAIAEAIQQRKEHHVEYRIVRPDGAVRWVEGRGQLFTDGEGRPERMVGVCSDVTERRHAEDKFRLAVEAAPAAMIMTDERGVINSINRLGEQLFGYRQDEIIGQSIEQLVPARFRSQHSSHRAGFFENARQRPMGLGLDLYALRKDGSEVPVEIGLSPFETADGRYVLAAVTDITARKQALDQLQQEEQQLRLAKREAEVANQLKDQFLATASHELRAPLSAVVGWADMLRAGILDETRRHRALQAVYANAKRQTQLIDDLLDVSRIVSGKMKVSRTAVDIVGVVSGALDGVQLSADAKRIHIETNIDQSIGKIFGDPNRLQQILSNLLSNSVKFTPANGTVRLTVRRVGNVVEMVVSDTGCGIAADFLPWVFERFRQADGSTTRMHGGLGLGLTIVKHLVETHGGTIAADSPGEGLGATFTVRLPIVAVYGGEEGSAVSSRRLDGEVPSLQNVAVLVVDDDADSRDLLTVVLEDAHATVFTATSSAEALEVLQRESIEVLLADIAMPGEDGYALIAKVRALDSPVKAMVAAAALTSLAGDEDQQLALEAGFQRHVSKPVESRVLIETVASLASRIARVP